MKHIDLPAVCIVGRPNVGKSTLFNRIVGKRKAVVHEISGTTRDRNEAIIEKEGKAFRLIDTGGFLKPGNCAISTLVKKHIEEGIDEADLLLFVCDAKTGIMPHDEEVSSILREANKKVILVVNKADNAKLEESVYDFYQVGLGMPYRVSAVHNIGVGSLVDDIVKAVTAPDKGAAGETTYKIAITGRPNVGKSFFLNTLLERERSIVDNTPGTTRDSIDTYFKKDDDTYLLIDTAGIRHKRKVKEPVDIYSMSRSHEAIERCDAAFLLIDGYDGLRNDDVRIFNYIIEKGKCCVIVVNKWDLVKNMEMAAYKKLMIQKLPDVVDYPIVFASAKTTRNVISCVDMVKHVVTNSNRVIETKELNKFLTYLRKSSVKVGQRTSARLDYMVQTRPNPPSFLIFINNIKGITEDYTNFIEGVIRREYNFYGTPVRINYRSKK